MELTVSLFPSFLFSIGQSLVGQFFDFQTEWERRVGEAPGAHVAPFFGIVGPFLPSCRFLSLWFPSGPPFLCVRGHGRSVRKLELCQDRLRLFVVTYE